MLDYRASRPTAERVSLLASCSTVRAPLEESDGQKWDMEHDMVSRSGMDGRAARELELSPSDYFAIFATRHGLDLVSAARCHCVALTRPRVVTTTAGAAKCTERPLCAESVQTQVPGNAALAGLVSWGSQRATAFLF